MRFDDTNPMKENAEFEKVSFDCFVRTRKIHTCWFLLIIYIIISIY